MVRVRFHLGAGEHHRQWQIRHDDGRVEYHDPDAVTLVMLGCRLRNQRRTSQRIFEGDNKSVCAWVEAQDVVVTAPVTRFWPGLDGRGIAFDPRIAPHWRDESGADIDGCRYEAVVTSGRRMAVGASAN